MICPCRSSGFCFLGSSTGGELMMMGVSSLGMRGGKEGLSVPGVPGTWGNIPRLRLLSGKDPGDWRMLFIGGGVDEKIKPFCPLVIVVGEWMWF